MGQHYQPAHQRRELRPSRITITTASEITMTPEMAIIMTMKPRIKNLLPYWSDSIRWKPKAMQCQIIGRRTQEGSFRSICERIICVCSRVLRRIDWRRPRRCCTRSQVQNQTIHRSLSPQAESDLHSIAAGKGKTPDWDVLERLVKSRYQSEKNTSVGQESCGEICPLSRIEEGAQRFSV